MHVPGDVLPDGRVGMDVSLGGQVRIPKTAEVVATRIRKLVVRGALKPGDKLPPESTLMDDFEVSRPTIREAIRILEAEGLISVSRGVKGGARVLGISSDLVTRAAGIALQAGGATMRDIYETRTLIEPPAARLAAERRPAEAAAALRAQLAAEWTAIDDMAARARAIAAFHRTLLEECGNTTLGMLGLALHDVVERHLHLSHRERRDRDAPTKKLTRLGFKSHERLIGLIEAGDGAGAEDHWISHMRAAGEVWLKGVASTSVVDILD